MKLLHLNKRCTKYVLIFAMLVTILWPATGCEDFSQFPPPTPPTETPAPEKAAPPTAISTADRAILAVYEHLLSQAGSHEAKKYLAEFYTVSDNWSAEKERFKDGSSIWYVLIDMTESEQWEWTPHWQQASWFILQNGDVTPSSRLQANALRIEADLQELSIKPEP